MYQPIPPPRSARAHARGTAPSTGQRWRARRCCRCASASSSARSISGSAFVLLHARRRGSPASCSAACASWSLRPAARAASSASLLEVPRPRQVRPTQRATRARRSSARKRPSWSAVLDHGERLARRAPRRGRARRRATARSRRVREGARLRGPAVVRRVGVPRRDSSISSRTAAGRPAATRRAPRGSGARASARARPNAAAASARTAFDSRASARFPAASSALARGLRELLRRLAVELRVQERTPGRGGRRGSRAAPCRPARAATPRSCVWYSARLDLDSPPYATSRISTCLKRYAVSPRDRRARLAA